MRKKQLWRVKKGRFVPVLVTYGWVPLGDGRRAWSVGDSSELPPGTLIAEPTEPVLVVDKGVLSDLHLSELLVAITGARAGTRILLQPASMDDIEPVDFQPL